MDQNTCKYRIEELAEELEADFRSMVKLFRNYFMEMDSEIEAMKDCLKNEQWDKLGRVIHNIKGVSANLDIYDVFEEARFLDGELKSGKTGSARQSVDKIEELLRGAKANVQAFFSQKGFTIDP